MGCTMLTVRSKSRRRLWVDDDNGTAFESSLTSVPLPLSVYHYQSTTTSLPLPLPLIQIMTKNVNAGHNADVTLGLLISSNS